ncbi:MAG TPA: EscU/YscU/HrcU family type III secretion system export apparatus switch protein [Opitutaceae bacterium]|nr:EscU/YscU/HrcU family type III secretion system export apparatus switch protein [Opitutaceae bacterium]
MADQDDDSKTELPTDKKKSEAMERGEFARSPELQVVVMLAAALGVFSMTLSAASRDIAALATLLWRDLAATRIEVATVPQQLWEVGLLIARVLVPVIAATVAASLLAGGFQTGFRISPKALGVKLERLDVMKGIQRVFSKNAAVHGVVDFIKMLGIGCVLWFSAQNLLADPLFSAPVEAAYLGDFLQRATVEFFGKLLFALGVIAGLSYAYERYKNFTQLKMTRQEVKDEHKQAEGDGQMKSAMRRMGRRLLQKQMLSAVPTADVVVTNPTHYAVALKYERGKDSAPVVLAKGENRFALRIKALAAENGVPIVENKPVARMLYGVGTVGEAIPSELYQAVAGILAFVYRTHRLYFHELKMRRAQAESAAARRAA